ncbi:MAG: UDP-N-acetylglucosamine 2-epimerase (non-hydrolyzing) [Desulfobacterium sp.]|nr:UDP-N-acetylglucosamine 2-epimerase (non-hydrolyzing) [Desulfobacterium sp.]MBU3948464.1 UDP-N-acetylglucosamine 2-epimerase (non-hydrolyzing) [Pseudomonadota bacterium]MBU4009283.1 UDP-N-acetylglucosamine 2-epimerase (non-hydrolyzing) [Pseudomonadota bacterium]MBU4036927.1 UDP-N-acetylglucosamine 2-epimerase (non-hydrolyzing) [Pseudomonadota bacterium]
MDNKKIKVLFVFGTRPEAIKMAPVIKECERNADSIDIHICVTAQHREMLDQVLGLFDINPHYDLDIMTKKQSLTDLTAHVLLGVARVLEREKPDVVFVQGDTTTTCAAAQAAFYLKIPVAHIEAGLRTNNKYSPFPEEINRRITSVMADLHFPPTEGAKRNLLAEGFEEASIFVTGNTVIDALKWVLTKHNAPTVNEKWQLWFLSEHNICLSNQIRTILVTGHRRESFGDGFHRICRALRILANNNDDIRIVYPVHLNPNVQEPVYSILGDMDNIHLIPPLDYEPFVFLMSQSYIILTDSGGIQEEAPTLGVPVLVMRDTSERPEGIEAGSARLVGTDVETIVLETQKLLGNANEYKCVSKVVNPYGDGKASERIVKVISEHFRSPIK